MRETASATKAGIRSTLQSGHRWSTSVFSGEFQIPTFSTFSPDPKVLCARAPQRCSGGSPQAGEIPCPEDRARLDCILRGCGILSGLICSAQTRSPRSLVLEEPMDYNGADADLVATRHRMMTDPRMAACDQTVHYVLCFAFQQRRSRDMTSRITRRLMKKRWTRSWAISPIPPGIRVAPWRNGPITCSPANFREGDGFADNSFIYATTDQSFAKLTR